MIRTIAIISALIVLLAVSVPRIDAAGNEGRTEAVITQEAALETAPVEIDGNVLFRVRGTSSYPAKQRAAAIGKRIEAVAADHSFPSSGLSLEEADDNAAMIMAGNNPLMFVTDADAKLEHLSRQYVSKHYLERIRTAIDEYRRIRTSDVLLKGGLNALGATVVLALTIALLIPVCRRLDKMLLKRVGAHIHNVGIQSFEILRAENIWKALQGTLYGARIAAIVMLSLVYLQIVLSLFPWTRGVAKQLLDLFTDALGHIGKTFAEMIPDLFILVMLYFLFRFVLRLLHHFFDAVERKSVTLAGFDAEWALPTYKIVRFGVVVFALIVAYPYVPGSESAAFKGISLFIGVVFSIGSSTAVSNIIAGYLLTYRRVFKTGDRVQVGEVVGTVMAMRLQVTHLLSLKHEEVTIPNSLILNGNVVNYSSIARKTGLILHTEVGIGYETPWRQVEAMLLQAAERTPGLLREPRPFILIKRLADFAVTYELNVYCDDPDQIDRHYTALHRQILDVFNEYGVQIMTPAYVADTPIPKVVSREQWYASPASTGSESPVSGA